MKSVVRIGGAVSTQQPMVSKQMVSAELTVEFLKLRFKQVIQFPHPNVSRT